MDKESFGEWLRKRSFQFSVEAIRFVQQLPRKSSVEQDMGRQLLRSATSIGANIEEAHGTRTRREWVNSLTVARKEAREANYWLRLFRESGVSDGVGIQGLERESEELLKILTSIVKRVSNP